MGDGQCRFRKSKEGVDQIPLGEEKWPIHCCYEPGKGLWQGGWKRYVKVAIAVFTFYENSKGFIRVKKEDRKLFSIQVDMR